MGEYEGLLDQLERERDLAEETLTRVETERSALERERDDAVAELQFTARTYAAACVEGNRVLAERDEARAVARAAYRFIVELDPTVEAGDPDTPEFELWVAWHIYQQGVILSPWLAEEEANRGGG